MIILISPAKTFAKTKTSFETTPVFQKEALGMINKLNKLSIQQLSLKMHLSSNLATKVKHDYLQFGKTLSCAIYTYDGYAYKGFDVLNMSKESLVYLKTHLYILSGLYGIVKPYDGISFYRLEMKDQVIRNLYRFWKPKISSYLLENHPDELFINLASLEYSKVIDTKIPMLTISFYQRIEKKLKAISMHVKLMRGKMANYIITHQINNIETLKEIVIDDYHYDENQSSNDEFVFIKEIIK